MSKLPKFRLFGEGNSKIEKGIQPILPLRDWVDLTRPEKEIAVQQLLKNGWIDEYSKEVLSTMQYMNYYFLRQLPGKRLHAIEPDSSDRYRFDNIEYKQMKAADLDFKDILLSETSGSLVYRMLSKFTDSQIDKMYYQWAEDAKEEAERKEHINKAFDKFDKLANCLNHIFEQFSVNIVVTRSGFVPRQDNKVVENVYLPTLDALSDPRWRSVSEDLRTMFENFKDGNYQETITIAHRSVQRFFQILVSEEGKNSKGELRDLFGKAKEQGFVSSDRFSDPIIEVISKFLPAERAKKSTAKPNTITVESRDALLVMNVVMILLQHCLQKAD